MNEFKAIEDGIREQLMVDLKNYFYEILGENVIEFIRTLVERIENGKVRFLLYS